LGMGEGKVRYRTSFLPKNRSGSGEVISAGTFQIKEDYYGMGVWKIILAYHLAHYFLSFFKI
jgi:hypothetical protein